MHHTFTPSACERLPFSGAERLLPAWNQYMGQARLSAERQVAYCHGIEAYSAFCRRHRLDATVETARRFMAESAGLGSLAPATVEVWEKALNWFFREARTHRSLALHGAPTLGRVDLGQTDWQRRPIERLRQLHYAWRTEETYRGWAWRYSESLDSRRVCWRRARITRRCRSCSGTKTWRGRRSILTSCRSRGWRCEVRWTIEFGMREYPPLTPPKEGNEVLRWEIVGALKR